MLSEVASLLLTSADVHQMLQHMFQKVGPHLGLDAYLNYVGSDSRNTLTLASYAGISQEAALAAARVEKGSGICGKVARTGSPSIENDVTGHEGLEWAAREGLRTYASYPLMSDGRLLGTVAFLSRTPGGLGDEDAAFLQTVTQYAAGACERLRLLEELREADARKNEFLATLAHELRNPLAPVRNAVQLLNLRGSPDPDCVTARGLIDRQIDHLIRLIDDLLDLSRITRNKVELRNEAVDVADLVRTAVEASLPAIKSAGHQLTVSMPDEPLPLMADPVRNAQVLTNLLNNAAKYTEPGGDIRLTAERDGDHVTIAVADNGIGIAEDKLPHVFEVFYQVDTSLERSRNGLGIGLSLVDRLVRLQGGTVEAFSDGPGKGSRFVVRLPLATDVTPALADVEDEHLKQEQRPERRRILIVDDNEDSAESLAMLLRVLGNEVWTAHDGLAGIEAVERNKPHVALIDLGMPKLNGYEACRRIREQPWGREIILMALTGWGQDKDRRRTRDAGFDAHLVKPVSTETLMTELTRCFEIQSQRFDAAVREARATAGS
ncbi:MAG TPA: ATP-binding protein [Candidatus Binatia bacterium]|nr:ATP-binding protein [Candidatus Binatia bacterium]